ncbi:MAG: prepilin-type N-terminal cleavage/methylation domain-containing protein [Patescibacteria group bacterium]|nr:prepilin-type N-terminal cleavage/methylation domain-containing protein [Patescibacteria group bacterium]
MIRFMYFRDRRAFTLTEVMIAVSIVTIMVVVPMVSYGNYMKRVRDTKRKNDINSIQTALEQYKAHQGRYPPSNDPQVLVREGYLDEWPKDPREGVALSGGVTFTYVYTATEDGSAYQLTARMEEVSENAVNPYNPDATPSGNDAGYYLATPIGNAEIRQEPGKGLPPTHTPHPTSTLIPTNTPRPTLTPSPTRKPLNTLTPTATRTPTPKPPGTPGPGGGQPERPKLVVFQSDATGSSAIVKRDISTTPYPAPVAITVPDVLDYHLSPELSPDQSTVLFYKYGTLENDTIYTVSVVGTQELKLTDSTERNTAPQWFPDGSAILFLSYRDSNFEIYRMNPDGSGQQRLTNAPGYDDFSRNQGVVNMTARKIVFYSDRDSGEIGTFDIFIMDLDGANQENLTNTPEIDEVDPVLSPDGTKIAFTRIADGNSDLYVMEVNGANQEQVTNSPLDEQLPFWGEDGTKLYGTAGYRLFELDLESGSTPPASIVLTTGISYDGFIRNGYMTFMSLDAVGGSNISLMNLQTKEIEIVVQTDASEGSPSH